MSSLHAAPSYCSLVEGKRRKLRKGTHSCWECKRRKMKCIYDSPVNATICSGCRRRGSKCLSQEFPEESPLPLHGTHDGDTHDEGVHAPRSEDDDQVNAGIPTPLSTTSDPPQSLGLSKSTKHENDIRQFTTRISASKPNYETLSLFLHGSLPSREDTERICKASRHPTFVAHEVMTIPYTTLEEKELRPSNSLLDIPEPNSHPVLIARHMLMLATFIQHLHPDLHKEIKGLLEPPRALMTRLVDIAVILVTTNDELLGSIEGLECVMMEGIYQANIGNIRRSWVSIRRAMAIAQLMGINRPGNNAQYKILDPTKKYYPHLMWFRIVFLDRFACLLLGLSQGSLDRSMASEALLANDTLMGRVERIHCVVASRILERNESKESSHNFSLTRSIDMELQKAARSLPSKWWLAPNFDTESTDAQSLFWDTRRLGAQVIHYNLLNQLHIPFMLRSSPGVRNYEYSRITCVNASREVLTRFITLRSFNHVVYNCRTVDFIALMAALTLLLAHIDSYQLGAENLLAHQYHSDRAMIEQVQENMKELNRLNSDNLSAQSADLLRRLLAIEMDPTAEEICPRSVRRVSVEEPGIEMPPDQDDDVAVSVHIPYFGVIKISREGMRKEVPEARIPTTTACASSGQVLSAGTRTYCPDILTSSGDVLSIGTSADTQTDSIAPNNILINPQNQHRESSTFITTATNDPVFSPSMQQGDYPELAAGAEDWAFQGVDLAFFESLMGNAGNEEMGRTPISDIGPKSY
ncbi:hypothetical protein ACMFMG_010185 [Clarireedia jacksonii]